jgi:hypothetical protein
MGLRHFSHLLKGVMISVGYSTAGWIGYACYPLEGNIQWRLPLGIQCIAPGILALGTYVLPESPRWCMRQARPCCHLTVCFYTNEQ